MPTHLPFFNAICPRCQNRVSRRLKRIGEEETGYHKPFSFDLKEVAYAKWNILETYRVDPCCVEKFYKRPNLDLEFRGRNSSTWEECKTRILCFKLTFLSCFLRYKVRIFINYTN